MREGLHMTCGFAYVQLYRNNIVIRFMLLLTIIITWHRVIFSVLITQVCSCQFYLRCPQLDWVLLRKCPLLCARPKFVHEPQSLSKTLQSICMHEQQLSSKQQLIHQNTIQSLPYCLLKPQSSLCKLLGSQIKHALLASITNTRPILFTRTVCMVAMPCKTCELRMTERH